MTKIKTKSQCTLRSARDSSCVENYPELLQRQLDAIHTVLAALNSNQTPQARLGLEKLIGNRHLGFDRDE